MTAESEDELIDRTLAAVQGLLGGTVALALGPVGSLGTHGDAAWAERLAHLDAAALRADPTRLGSALTRAGLRLVHLAQFGDTVIVLATAEPRLPDPGAAAVFELVIAHAHAARERLRQLDLLTRRANSDPLTGLRHHRLFSERLAESRPGRTAIITLDVDRFKTINDRYGHEAGDHALVMLVDAMRAALRDEDQLYRIGGDEFAVVVDVNDPAEALAIALRLLAAGRRVGHTVSVGAAVHIDGETGRETLVRADRALYDAKRAGRDTVRLAA